MKVTVALLAITVASVQASNIHPMILGGNVVPAGQKTYTAGLRETDLGLDLCGGSLITPTHVLTAGHCAGFAKYITVGSHYGHGNKDGEIIAVKNETRHPLYVSEDSLTYDYTIIELATPSRFPPIQLSSADPETAFAGQSGTLLGWGTTKTDGPVSYELLRVNVPVLSHEQCVASKLTSAPLTETMFCAGGQENEDSCQGDSGGPIILERGTQDVLIGVVSWGDGCGIKDQPGVYAKVSFVKSWIQGLAPNATFVDEPGQAGCPSN